MTYKKPPMPFVILFLLSIQALTATGQQTIFNVPSADIMDRGKVYAELDASFKTNVQPAAGRFSSFVPRIVVGAGRNVEAGLNLAGNVQPGNDSTTLVPSIKWRFYKSEDGRSALFAGTNVFVPVRNRAYRVGAYSYAAASRTIGRTRVTAGGFLFTRNVAAPNAARGGGQFAVEQTLGNKFSLAADWLTGKHANGYFTPGAIYKPRPNMTAYIAYSIGNQNARRGNHFFLFEFGYNF